MENALVMDENNQAPVENQAQPQDNTMLDDGTVKANSFVEGIDMDAINEAVDSAKFTTANPKEQATNIDDISLDNTPTSDAELSQQLEQNPGMSLANSAAAPETPKIEKPSISANIDRPEVVPEEAKAEKKEDPSKFDAPTVDTPIIAPSRSKLPKIMLYAVLLIAVACLVYVIFFSGLVTLPWTVVEE